MGVRELADEDVDLAHAAMPAAIQNAAAARIEVGAGAHGAGHG
jgi:hypothetical protein